MFCSESKSYLVQFDAYFSSWKIAVTFGERVMFYFSFVKFLTS